VETTQTKLLAISAELFAENGFSGVSMRAVARRASVTQAAIYHHFTNKEELYLATLEHVYEGQISEIVSVVSRETEPESQLAIAVARLLEVFDQNALFRRIYFRELLDGDQKRLKLLADGVFAEIDLFLRKLMAELAPDMDSHLLVLDLAGLILHHLEARKISAQLDSGQARHQQLPYIADHITALLLHGVRRP
jgi:AcrR family transcriptional regulator